MDRPRVCPAVISFRPNGSAGTRKDWRRPLRQNLSVGLFRLTQLITSILSLVNTVSCHWNAHGPAFLRSSDSVVEEFQPAICRADDIVANSKILCSLHLFEWQNMITYFVIDCASPAAYWMHLGWSNISRRTVPKSRALYFYIPIFSTYLWRRCQ